jgi:hypothetical protein
MWTVTVVEVGEIRADFVHVDGSVVPPALPRQDDLLIG